MSDAPRSSAAGPPQPPAQPEPGSAAHGIAKALEYKASGNEAFKRGDYKAALGQYHSGSMFIIGQNTSGVSKEEATAISDLKVANFSNLAMCHMKLENFEKARDNCTKALAVDPTNVKALFRRGKCHGHLGALDEAKSDLEQVLARDSDNADARREMHALKGRFAEQKKKEQKKFAGFFDKLQAGQPSQLEGETGQRQAEEATSGLGADPAGAPVPQYTVHLLDDAQDDDDIGEPLADPVSFEPSSMRVWKAEPA